MSAIVQPSNMQRVAREFPKPEASAKSVQVHASDKPGEIAFEAAQFGHVVQLNLLAVASPVLTPEKRLEACERLFQAWSALCDRMGKLEAACPASSAAGYEQAAILRHTAERPAKPRDEQDISRDLMARQGR